MIKDLGVELNLPSDWLNGDFKSTDSFSTKLKSSKCTTYYKTYCQILNVSTIKPIYILCMKLISFRKDTNDIDDIIKLVADNEFKLDEINNAFTYLYDVNMKNKISKTAYSFLIDLLNNK